MSQADDETQTGETDGPDTPEQTDTPGTGHKPDKPWYRQTRNIVGLSIAMVLVLVALFGVSRARKPDLVVDCEATRVEDLTRSKEFLVAELNPQVVQLDSQLRAAKLRATRALEDRDAIASEATTLDQRIQQTQQDLDEATATVDALSVPGEVTDEGADEGTGEGADDPPAATDGEGAPGTPAEQPGDAADLDDAEAALELQAARDLAADLTANLQAQQARRTEIQASRGEAEARVDVETANRDQLETQLDQKKAALAHALAIDPTAEAEPLRAWSPARSSITFSPDVAVAKIHFGSTRNAKRVEIRLVPQNETPEGGEVTVEEAAAAPIPDLFWFYSDTDQLRRNSGLEIPAEQVTTWARRYGEDVFLNICINPNSALDAGKYVGSVHIADATIRPVSIPVEVTAQSMMTSWILWTLLFAPILAFLFVWIKLRHAANEDPSLLATVHGSVTLAHPFRKWIKSNFILSFVVGVGAVWATLQVPLSNETFGDSLIKAAAAVVVTLVAAVGAITPVVGKVRGDEIGDAEHDSDD